MSLIPFVNGQFDLNADPSGGDVVDTTPPNLIVPTVELPVVGVRPPDRKWWVDQFVSELDNGQFANSGRLGDGIKRNARILGSLEQRNSGLFGAPLELTPSTVDAVDKNGKKEPSELAIQIRDEIEQNWEKMFPRCELEKLNQYGVLQGIGIAEKFWDTTTTPWTFTIDVRHPQFYLWLWNTGCYHLITLNRSLVRVPRRGTQFIVHTPYGYKNAFLDARIRALVDPWMMSQWTQTDWARWCEVHGNPIRKAIVPQQSNPAEEKAFVRSVGNMNANTVVKTKQDADGNKYDIELVEAVAMGWKGFEAMLAWADAKISEVICGQAASMDGQGGLNSQEEPGKGVRLDVKKSDNAKLCETLYSQALREYCEYNYGNPDLAPRPNYIVAPPEDKARKALEFKTWVDGLVAAKNAAVPVNDRSILEDAGIPVLSKEDQAALEKAKADKEQADAEAQRSHDMALMQAKTSTPIEKDE